MHMDTLVLLKVGLAGSQIDIAGSAELTRRLEDVGFLTVIDLYLLHVVQREAS